MLLTLALVILVGSIFVFFADEFKRTFKRLFAIKGAKLFLPLVAASWLIYTFDDWFLWAVYYYLEVLQNTQSFFKDMMPAHAGLESLVLILLLTVISVAPVVLMDVISRRKTYLAYRYPYITSGIIWIMSVAFLIIK